MVPFIRLFDIKIGEIRYIDGTEDGPFVSVRARLPSIITLNDFCFRSFLDNMCGNVSLFFFATLCQ